MEKKEIKLLHIYRRAFLKLFMRLSMGTIAYKEIITQKYKSNQTGQVGWAQKSMLSNNVPKETKEIFKIGNSKFRKNKNNWKVKFCTFINLNYRHSPVNSEMIWGSRNNSQVKYCLISVMEFGKHSSVRETLYSTLRIQVILYER